MKTEHIKMDKHIPDPPPPEVTKNAETENQASEQERMIVSSYKYGEHYENRANEIKKQNCRVISIGLFLLVIIHVMLFCSFLFDQSIYAIKNATLSLFAIDKINTNHIIIIYYISKISILIFWFALFWWCARIFNQLRRLEITYRDKYIVAETYEKFIENNKDEQNCNIVKETILKHLFAPSLEQAENNIQKRHLTELLKDLLKLIRDIKNQ